MNKKISELAALGEVPQLNSYASYDNGIMPDYRDRKVFTMKFLEVSKILRQERR